ncbi:hypothetical protein ES705_11022 [subsurface metagenome]
MIKMKNNRNYWLSALCFLIFFINFPINSFSNIVLGESVFPAETNDKFVWETVNATESLYMEVDYIRFTATNIYRETDNDKNYLFVNYTLEYYHRYRYSWGEKYENSFYMAYNKTLNLLNWSAEGFQHGNLFLFPTPVNYTLIGEAIKKGGFFNYSISGEKVILDYGNSTTIELTIDPSGISTIIERITNGTTIYRWELNTEEIIIKVPFGNYYLIVLIISVMTLVIVKKKKMLMSFKH